MRRLPLVLLFVPLALVLSACGSKPSNGVYSAASTAKCLRDKGFNVSTSDKDVALVIQSADLGGLRAWHTKAGNQLQIAFMQSRAGTNGEVAAIRRVAPKSLRPHLADVTRVQGNAVLLWTIAPTDQDAKDALGCLSS